VQQFHADFDDLLVVPLDLVQLVDDVHPVVLGHLDVSTLDDDVHA
jgi:hypothetical protein